VLAQLGSRIAHQLRAHTPDDAKALKATVNTFPRSSYDLAELLTQLGIGQAVVTVMDPDGVPTPVAWTRVFAPESKMGPTDAAQQDRMIAASPMMARYGRQINRDSAYEMLARKLAQGAENAQSTTSAHNADRTNGMPLVSAGVQPKQSQPKQSRAKAPSKSSKAQKSVIEQVADSSAFKQFARSAGREVVRSIFGTARRR